MWDTDTLTHKTFGLCSRSTSIKQNISVMPPYSLALRAAFTRNLTGQLKTRLHAKSKQFWKKNDMPLSLSSSTMQLTLHIHTAGCVVGTKTIGSMTNVTSWFIPLDSFHVKHLTEWYNCTRVCSGPSYIGRWVTSSIAVKCHIITLSNRRGTLLDCHHWCIWK